MEVSGHSASVAVPPSSTLEVSCEPSISPWTPPLLLPSEPAPFYPSVLTTSNGNFPDPNPPIGRVADAMILLVYGGVIFFFVFRFIARRKAPSIFVACLPLGWILVALWSLGILHPLPYGGLRWLGVVVGITLLASLIRMEIRELRSSQAGRH